MSTQTVSSWKPWAVFFKKEPTEKEQLDRELNSLFRELHRKEWEMEKLKDVINYTQHKLNYWNKQE